MVTKSGVEMTIKSSNYKSSAKGYVTPGKDNMSMSMLRWELQQVSRVSCIPSASAHIRNYTTRKPGYLHIDPKLQAKFQGVLKVSYL